MTLDRPRIPDSEFVLRIKRLQAIMVRENVDLLLAFGNEAEPQFLRYLSDYWPSFETAGVLLAKEGDPLLLIGPECLTYATERSRIQRILRLSAFRESSNPEYPGHQLATFADAVESLHVHPKRFAIAGFNLIPHVTYREILASLCKFGDIIPERGDEMLMELRMIKSENELACLRRAADITRVAFDRTLAAIEPGMTELQVRGIACGALYECGAENEAYPIWVLTGAGCDQAISRARQKPIGKNDAVMLQIGARYEGYASSIGRPVFFGSGHERLINALHAAYEAQTLVLNELYDGNNASNVARVYYAVMEKAGFADRLLYGPCHATGLMEGEPPWIESNSDYPLWENMCYCADFFLGFSDTNEGFRVEDSVVVGKTSAINLTHYPKEVFRK